VRYTPDVVNAENWNTGLKKSLTHDNSSAGESIKHQKSGAPKTGKNMRASNTDMIRFTKPDPSSATPRVSKKRLGKRNKKRGMFILSRLFFGLDSRGRNDK
jgi:hypothetical protein